MNYEDFKILRLILAAMMIGFSVILPVPPKDDPRKHPIEQKDTKDDELED